MLQKSLHFEMSVLFQLPGCSKLHQNMRRERWNQMRFGGVVWGKELGAWKNERDLAEVIWTNNGAMTIPFCTEVEKIPVSSISLIHRSCPHRALLRGSHITGWARYVIIWYHWRTHWLQCAIGGVPPTKRRAYVSCG